MIIAWPDTATLTGALVDDDGWITFSYLWEQVVGPDVAVIATPDALVTDITFPPVQGQYVFQLTVSGDTFPSDFNDYWLSETNEQLLTEDGQPLIIEEANTLLSSSALFRVFLLTAAEASNDGPSIHGKDLYIKIAGVDYVTGALDPEKTVDADSLSIQENKDSTPNTASFTVRGFVPTIGQEVIITLDTIRIFAGQFLRSSHTSEELLDNDYVQISVPDYTWHFNRYKITANFDNVSASAVAAAIVAKCPGFSGGKIQGGLPPVSINFKSATLASAFGALCEKIPGSTWKPDYFKVVYFGTSDLSPDQPEPITVLHPTCQNFTVERDLGQWITRVRVNGAATSSNRDRETAGKLFVTGIEGFKGESGNVNVDGYDTTYSLADQQPKPKATDTPAPDEAPDANCDPLEDQIRRTNLKVEARAIRTGMLGSGLPIGDYTYYTTYVTQDGESGWKDSFTVGLTNMSIPTFLPGSGPGGITWDIKYHYNAVEFIATAFPLGLQRINIYRAAFVEPYNEEHTNIVVGDGGKLIASIVGKGIFGELGTDGPIIGSEGGGVAANLGIVITPSTNSVVDSVFLLPEDEQALPAESIPTEPICTDPVTGRETPSDDIEYFLDGIPDFKFLESGIRVQRFVIVSDSGAISTLGTLLGDGGVIEDEISDTDLLSEAAMIEAGRNRMAERNKVDLSISYACRDQNTHPGKYVAVDMPDPFNCHNEFLIQTVTINGFGLVGDGGELKSWPLYTVSKAAPRQKRLMTILSQ